MAYTLEQLSTDIREILKADSGTAGKQSVCKLVSKVLLDQEFVAKHLTAEQCRPRKVLYEDPDTRSSAFAAMFTRMPRTVRLL